MINRQKQIIQKYLKHSECVVLTGKHRAEWCIWGWGKTQDIVDSVGAEVVVGVLAVDVMVIDVTTTDKQIGALNMPDSVHEHTM